MLFPMGQTHHRPDVDIEADIEQLVRSFAPLKASRSFLTFRVEAGHVIIEGNVRNPQARRVLVENVPRIEGVSSIDHSRLYDDEMVRFAVGQILPPGIFAAVQYGNVALTGRLSLTASADAIIQAVKAIPGVRRVGATLTAPDPSETAPGL
jgi:osmotically-inducible protein OsmY